MNLERSDLHAQHNQDIALLHAQHNQDIALLQVRAPTYKFHPSDVIDILVTSLTS